MAGLGGKNWTFQEEVTSSDVNGYLADQVVMRFADEATRTAGFGGAGEPTLAEGMVSYLDDQNRVDVYNGSAWVNVATGTINSVGLELIKVQTIGTTVSSVTVSDVFSSTYDNYVILISGGTPSTGAESRITLGATTSGYYYAGQTIDYSGAGSGFVRGANAAYWQTGAFYGGGVGIQFFLSNPFASDETTYSAIGADVATNAGSRFFAGYLNNTTSYTAFTITPSTGTLTGGTIRVYGYRNS